MNTWTELLDSGHDPGRYTLVHSTGLVVVANENGTLVRQRTVASPIDTVTALSRTRGIRIVPPARQADIIKKINRYLTPDPE